MPGDTTRVLTLLLSACFLVFLVVHAASQSADSGTEMTVGGTKETVYKVGYGVEPPKATYSPKAEYSAEARSKGVSGHVVVALIVPSKGEVKNIMVAKSLGSGLDEKAIEAVGQWKFNPATKDGKPVSVVVAVDVAFHP